MGKKGKKRGTGNKKTSRKVFFITWKGLKLANTWMRRTHMKVRRVLMKFPLFQTLISGHLRWWVRRCGHFKEFPPCLRHPPRPLKLNWALHDRPWPRQPRRNPGSTTVQSLWINIPPSLTFPKQAWFTKLLSNNWHFLCCQDYTNPITAKCTLYNE